jgi:hypothetical protein
VPSKLPDGSEENNEKRQSGWSGFGPTFEPATPRNEPRTNDGNNWRALRLQQGTNSQLLKEGSSTWLKRESFWTWIQQVPEPNLCQNTAYLY